MDASRTLKNRRGIAAVYLALLLFVLVGFAALTIDIGYFHVVKSQLQNAADAAALAGVSALKGQISTNPFANESSARNRAQYFAGKNSAETSAVTLDLNSGNDTTGDIVIGCWNETTQTMDTDTGCSRPNSILVNARRSGGAGAGRATPTPVGTFFGKIFNINTMNIGARAVAKRPSKPTVPLAICSPEGTGICSISGSNTFYFQESSHPAEWTTGWTEFSVNSKATDLGKNSTIADLLRGTAQIPDNVCNQTVWTNTGIGVAIDVLQDMYDLKKDASGRWKVIIPIFETCPSASQPGEKYNRLIKYASADVTNIESKGAAGIRGFTIDNISCADCSFANFLSDTSRLVK